MRTLSAKTCDQGNRTLLWSQLCDGIFDCDDRSDEGPSLCKRCIRNMYPCPPHDDIRCDLACSILGYVPCQAIQDRQACQKMNVKQLFGYDFPWLDETIAMMLISIGVLLIILTFLLYTYRKFSVKEFNRFDPTVDYAATTTAIHVYERCDDYRSTKTYYEHAV